MKIKLIVGVHLFCCALPSYSQLQQTSGPTGGLITSLAFIGPNLFAGTAGTGVFRSADNGNSWFPINSGINNRHITSLAVMGSNIFAGTINNGLSSANDSCVFISVNNGASWASADAGLPNTSVYCLTVLGNNVFAGTNSGGIYRSNNNGANWIAVNNGLPSNSDVGALFVKGNTVYAGVNDSIFFSTDNGNSWTAANSGSLGNSITALASLGPYLYAAVWNSGIFRSDDYGLNWSLINNTINVCSFTSVGNNLYAGTYNDGVFVSTNYALSWTPLNINTSHTNARALIVNGADLFAGTGEGVFRSLNGGNTWERINKGLIATNAYSFAVKGDSLIVSTMGGSVFFSTNSGDDWFELNSGLNTNKIRILGYNGNYLFAGTDDGWGNVASLWRFSDYDTNWTPSDIGILSDNVRAFAFIGNHLFAGTGGAGVFQSYDNGNNWSSVNTGFTWGNSSFINSLVVSENNVLAGSDNAYHLANNNTTWLNLKVNGNNPIGVSSFATIGSNWFAGTGQGVYRSIDSGITWSQVNNGLSNSYVYSLASSGNFLFAGTDVWNGGGGGVFFSTDYGDHWTKINVDSNYPLWTTTYSLAVVGNTLYAATAGYGAGVFKASICSLPCTTNCAPPPPAVLNASVCYNNSTSLSASGTGAIGWYSEETGGIYLGGGPNFITPKLTSTTTYFVQDSTCWGSSLRTAVTITVNSLPTVIAEASATSVCAGDSVILNGGGASSYQWSDGIVNGISFTPSVTNTYAVIGTDANNCSDTASITIKVNPVPIVFLSLDQDTVCSDTELYPLSGGWPAGGEYSGIGVSGEIFYTGSVENGLHDIVYTYLSDVNGCSNSDTAQIFIDECAGITQTVNGNFQLSILPNPSSAKFTILSSEKINSIKVRNVVGETISTSLVNSQVTEINLNNQPQGIYFVEVVCGEGRKVKKIILE